MNFDFNLKDAIFLLRSPFVGDIVIKPDLLALVPLSLQIAVRVVLQQVTGIYPYGLSGFMVSRQG